MTAKTVKNEKRKIIDQHDLPTAVTKLENIVISMKDGAKLYAHIWIPESYKELTGADKIPTILEYLPYRKNDFTAVRDSMRHPYFAGHGYASMRVDMRGTGDSDGWLLDEYRKQEQDDCLAVFDWIIDQPWSNGNIGMWGKSWGGFNGLQVAARQHDALKTVISLCSTDDRYADDVHYRGGTLLASDMLWWASTMFAYNARPQDPEIRPSWRENWLQERLKTPPNVVEWVKHQRRDSYWKHGSVCEDFNKLNIPIMLAGGWKDGYTNAIFRMIKKLPHKLSKAIVGPWVHEFPEVGTPEPSIGFLQVSVKWYDAFLKCKGDLDLDLPKITAYIQEPEKPLDCYGYRKGDWVGLSNYPYQETSSYKLYLTKTRGLSDKKNSNSDKNEEIIEFTGIEDHGLFRGVWCPFGQPGDFAPDQAVENAKATIFRGDPIDKDMTFLGQPILYARIASNKKQALLSVRLMIEFPSGEITLISWGIMNLNHRLTHEHPSDLNPGTYYDIPVQLDVLGQTLGEGQRILVALSPTDWPQAWPSIETPTLSIDVNNSYLQLPQVSQFDKVDIKFDAPEITKPIKEKVLRKESRSRQVVWDVAKDEWRIDDRSDEGKRRLCSTANGIEFGSINWNKWTIKRGDPLSAYNECIWELTIGRGDWQIKLDCFSSMKSDRQNFYLRNKIKAYENEKLVFQQDWLDTVSRYFQ